MATRAVCRAAQQETSLREERSAEQQVTDEEIARRAFEISLPGEGGSDLDNWLRAEAELRRPV